MLKLKQRDSIVIEAGHGLKSYWRDVISYRELFLFLVYKDFLVRYKQTVIGIAWSVLRPVVTTLIFIFVFKYIAKVDSKGIPYSIIILSGLTVWNFFVNSFVEASNSLIANANLLTKVYFPRIIIPTSTVIVNIFDTMISFIMLFILMFISGYSVSVKFLYVPVTMFFVMILALGGAYFVSALNVKFRDFKYIIPFITQIGYFISPIGYLSSNLDSSFVTVMGREISVRLITYLNPVSYAVDLMRWSLLDEVMPDMKLGFVIAFPITMILFVMGIRYFRRMEITFADDV